MDVKFLKGPYSTYETLVPKDEGAFYLTADEGTNYNKLFLGSLEITSGKSVDDLREEITAKIGDLTNLNTITKKTLVEAINELVGKIGSATLTTEAQTLTEAVNELQEAIESIAADEKVTIESTEDSSLHKKYTVKQGEAAVATTIDIDKVTVEDTTASTEDTLHKQYTIKQGIELAEVTIDIDKISLSSTGGGSSAKIYNLKQGQKDIGTIEIPVDLVVKSGKIAVVTEDNKDTDYPDAPSTGTYIELTLSTTESEKIYIDVKDLIDEYIGSDGEEITVTIDKQSRTVSATIKANAVSTEKIANNAVTKNKLGTDVEERFTAIENALTWQKITGE